ncbi:hypothetical protein SLEP1_g18180 [Rubroshorea leprosula]|uniref:Uncharacterized protein n=1 Tax=Rubroshorea leprosula TaxID=152421 RepID=A0AAV5J5L2_9ROSI|nr:hypothetical protein SLEP1_g18180 [Rubroshorea leprosula]
MSDHMETNRNSIVPDHFISLALRSSLRFYASEEAKPRTGKPREVTS